MDGLTSLAVLFSAVAVWLGYPLADPIVGLVITVAILAIVWESGKTVFTRLLDGVDPEVTDEITHALNHAQGVRDVTEIRLRWSGHRLHAEINLAVSPKLSAAEGHAIAVEARHQLMHSLPYLSMSRSTSIRKICPEKNIMASQSKPRWLVVTVRENRARESSSAATQQ